MLVRMFMSRDLVTCSASASKAELERLMAKHSIRRLPILDEKDGLVGIVGPIDIANAKSEEATASDLMTRQVMTTTPESPIEEVASLMCDLTIGAVPVMEESRLIGILSQSDVFRALGLLLRGEAKPGLRVTFECAEGAGSPLVFLADAVGRFGGSLRSVVSYELGGQSFVTARVHISDADPLLDALWSSGHRVHSVQGAQEATARS